MISIVALIIEYVRTMIIYVIFYSFVEMLLPKSNFKKYVSLVMGLIMIIIVLNPIINLLNQDHEPLQKQIVDIDTELAQRVTSLESNQYEEIQNKMIIENYKSQLTSQINTLVTNKLSVSIQKVDIDVESDAKSPNYGQIKSIHLSVRDSTIITEPVEIQITPNEQSTESELSKNIKKIISDFYNMSADNIHVLDVNK